MKTAPLRILCATAAVSAIAPAWADAGDTLNISAGYTVQSDSNVFRLPSNSTPAASLGTSKKSDRIDTSYVNLAVDKQYSLQQFQLNARYNDYRYQNFESLNFAGLDYKAAWLWSLTPRIRGTLSSDRKVTLNNFDDITGLTVRNVRTDANLRLDGEVDMGAAVRLLGALDRKHRTNESKVSPEGDSTVDSVVTGLRYVFPSSNFVSYRVRKGTGTYDNRVSLTGVPLPTGFDETEHELRGGWKPTGKTAVTARISRLERVNPGFSQRDYSGPTGSLGMQWSPTAKIDVAAGLSRTLSSYQTDTSSFLRSNRLTIAPTWKATAHTSLRFNYDYLTEEYDGALPGQGLPANRRDITHLSQLTLDWRPRQFVALTFSIQNQRRSSNTVGFDYTSNGATIGAEVNF